MNIFSISCNILPWPHRDIAGLCLARVGIAQTTSEFITCNQTSTQAIIKTYETDDCTGKDINTVFIPTPNGCMATECMTWSQQEFNEEPPPQGTHVLFLHITIISVFVYDR